MTIEQTLQTLAQNNLYLILIYDGEYNHYVVEVLDPYGDVKSAGLNKVLDDAIKEALEELEDIDR